MALPAPVPALWKQGAQSLCPRSPDPGSQRLRSCLCPRPGRKVTAMVSCSPQDTGPSPLTAAAPQRAPRKLGRALPQHPSAPLAPSLPPPGGHHATCTLPRRAWTAHSHTGTQLRPVSPPEKEATYRNSPGDTQDPEGVSPGGTQRDLLSDPIDLLRLPLQRGFLTLTSAIMEDTGGSWAGSLMGGGHEVRG